MIRPGVVASCFLMFSVFPFAGSAQSINKNPGTVSVHDLRIPDTAMIAFNNGLKLLAAQDHAGSIREFQRAIKKFPGFYEAYAKLGVAEMNLQKDSDAEQAFRRAIDLSGGTYGEPYFGLGILLCDVKKQFAEAESTIRDGLNADPTNAAGHFALAWLLYNTNRLSEAEESARDAVFYAPNSAVVYLLLAKIHVRENNRSAMTQDMNAYMRLVPNALASAKAGPADTQQVLAQQTAVVVPTK
jgi:tetratricopeptide (TPR) repeat protein